MRCRDCQQEKAEDDFPRNKRSSTGRGIYCKLCHNNRTRRNRQKNGGASRYHLRARYGIEPHELAVLIESQHGLCAVCSKTEATQVDHDHRTGKVRGILCLNCNAGLGALKDDPKLIWAAIDYLDPVPLEELCN
jgi:hypothetical protein